jgi:hypothetical protein
MVNGVFKSATGELVAKDAHASLVYAVWALGCDVISGASTLVKDAGIDIGKVEFRDYDKSKHLSTLYTMTDEQLHSLMSVFASAIASENAGIDSASNELKASYVSFGELQGKIEDYFVITEEMLTKQTIPQIRLTLSDSNIGFDKWYNEKQGDDRAFDSLSTKKKPEFIKEVMAQKDFDWTGKVPAFVLDIAKNAQSAK